MSLVIELRNTTGLADVAVGEGLVVVAVGVADGLEACDINPLGQPQLKWKSNFTQAEFEDVVNRSKEYIKAGDIFQVVPSQRFEMPYTGRPIELFRALRHVNPSPYMFCLELGDFALVG